VRFSPESREIVHAELVLIHPFRDGNGRCARLLSTLMGVHAGLPLLLSPAFTGSRNAVTTQLFALRKASP
jgi:hypothetical protein